MIREYLVVLGYILALVLGAGLSVVAWCIARCFPTGESDRPAPPVTVRGTKFTRDISIGKDQHIGERQARLRELQVDDVDVARRDKPQRPTPRDIEMRREAQRLSKGW